METARVVAGAEMVSSVFLGNGLSSDAQEITGILGEWNFHCHSQNSLPHTITA